MPSCSRCSCSPLPYLKKKFKFKRPTKATIIRLAGWYATRAVAGLLWCAVIWAFIGKDALPAYGKSSDSSPCVPQHDLNNESLYEILDSLILPPNTNTAGEEYTFGNYSYLYTCNSNYDDDQYCLVTLGLDQDCANKVTFNVSVLNNLSYVDDQNYSTTDYNFTFDIDKEIELADAKPSYSLFVFSDGHFFALMVLVVAASIGGMVARVFRLPPLLGMMIAGFLLRNLPVVGIAGDISPVWSSTLRYTVLVIILIRGGMALEVEQLWNLKLTLSALALFPGFIEAGVAGVIAIFLLGMPWEWGLLLGLVTWEWGLLLGLVSNMRMGIINER